MPSRVRLPRQRTTGQVFLVLASLPVMAYVLPLGDLMQRFHLDDTVMGVTLAEAAVTAPLAIYVLRGFLAQLSPEWEEAALLEGASTLRVLVRVVVPLAAETLVATATILFVIDWNLLLIPLVVAGVEVRPVPVAMVDFFTFERELDWPTAAAALVVSVLPLVIALGLFHRLLDRFALDPGRAGRGVSGAAGQSGGRSRGRWPMRPLSWRRWRNLRVGGQTHGRHAGARSTPAAGVAAPSRGAVGLAAP